MIKNDDFMLFLKVSRNNDNLVTIGPYYEDVNTITSRQCYEWLEVSAYRNNHTVLMLTNETAAACIYNL